jgi:hypothetical protein
MNAVHCHVFSAPGQALANLSFQSGLYKLLMEVGAGFRAVAILDSLCPERDFGDHETGNQQHIHNLLFQNICYRGTFVVEGEPEGVLVSIHCLHSRLSRDT